MTIVDMRNTKGVSCRPLRFIGRVQNTNKSNLGLASYFCLGAGAEFGCEVMVQGWVTEQEDADVCRSCVAGRSVL